MILNMLIGIVLVQAPAVSASPPAPPTVALPNMARPTGRLDIPDEIAPAVVPYFACLAGRMNRRGAEWMSGDRRSPATPSNEEIVRSCEGDRARALTHGLALLGRSGAVEGPARGALVERTLRDIEGFLTAPSPQLITGD